MKMIEENRKKNEAKRAAQSARNAEITAAFEQRMQSGGPVGAAAAQVQPQPGGAPPS